jgi:LysR family transcriptional regulator, cell division regulator
MELNELRIFKVVAEVGSVTRAAERLNCVQSNVTARIHQLEERLNVPLFYRKSRGVVLTPVGHIFLDYAKRILSLHEEAVRTVQEQESPTGRLTIGALECAAALRMPWIFSEFHSRHPKVDVQLLTGTSEQMLAALLEYRVDAAFVGGTIAHPDLLGEALFKEEFVLACPKGVSPQIRKKEQDILVFPKGCAFRPKMEIWLRENNVTSYRLMEFNSVEMILACILNGMGITFLPRAVFAHGTYDSKIELYALPPDIAMLPVNFVRRRSVSESKALTAFRTSLRHWILSNKQRSTNVSIPRVVKRSDPRLFHVSRKKPPSRRLTAS